MEYYRTYWQHDDDYPVWIYSEIDSNQMKLFFLKTWENIDFKRILKFIQIKMFPTKS